MSLKFCIIVESKSQKTCIAIVLYTNLAAVTSPKNRECSPNRYYVEHLTTQHIKTTTLEKLRNDNATINDLIG